ncbi:UDP-N-acetylhexosamine pyrophosphorylase [Sipha flava]|jgi:UDP-N-acetylglucosamine/UDP-N-acetylgalactosamine diphosphorylase|uniref:UDP-N-acetylglucosamine diphosphorylase n=1 Tax=Sipha flava TaxID=143950 RepID=A0A2S2QDB6_9HEMI|nr:UDP-N-acetylhexosamine pyrophosphorylase [Sipha flava]
MFDFDSAVLLLKKYDQEHILRFWDKLDEKEKKILLDDIHDINIPEVIEMFRRTVENIRAEQQKLDDKMNPIPAELYGAVNRSPEELLTKYEQIGLEQISQGRVGVLLMAGGQGTRLGVSYPKGMYDIGLPSHKSLYRIQGERIRRLINIASKKYGSCKGLPWFIMTSEHTMEPTRKYFKENDFFGLNESKIVFFEQYMLPAFTFDGKIIMESTYKISKSPDGNGGIYKALRDRNVLDEIKKLGVQYLHAHSVDNILVKVADPIFIGYCITKNAECGAKVVEKAYPSEPLGVVCEVNGKFQVVEYSEITEKTAEKQNPDGRLTFSAGNICNHFFTTDFLTDIAHKYNSELKLHIAKKKISYVDGDGNVCKSEKPNGIKMEKFIFDVFEFCNRLAVWEVERNEEFSALKNADIPNGKDNPKTARLDVFSLHRKFVEKAGGKFVRDNIECEISPLLSYAGESLRHLVDGKTFDSILELKSDEEMSTFNGN